MHKLNRPEAPDCLSKFKIGDDWGKVSWQDKDEIWINLKEMQGARCAYCETTIILERPYRKDSAHIEHLRQKNKDVYPEGTFAWSNLFGSCNNEDSCGKHKDNQNGCRGTR